MNEKILDLSPANIGSYVSFGTLGSEYTCDYAGVIGLGKTLQEAFDSAFSEHQRLCQEEDAYHEMSD